MVHVDVVKPQKVLSSEILAVYLPASHVDRKAGGYLSLAD